MIFTQVLIDIAGNIGQMCTMLAMSLYYRAVQNGTWRPFKIRRKK